MSNPRHSFLTLFAAVFLAARAAWGATEISEVHITDVGTTAFSALAQMIYGLFFVVTLLVFPRGLVGQWLRRRADKRVNLEGSAQ